MGRLLSPRRNSRAVYTTLPPVDWTPANLATAAEAWWEPSDGTTVTLSGSEITSLTDKSGNGHTASPVSGFSGATLVASGLNSLDTMTFNGNRLMFHSGEIDLQDFYYLVVGKLNSSASNTNFYMSNKSTDASSDRMYVLTEGARFGSATGVTEAASVGTWRLHSCVKNGNPYEVWSAGTSIGTSSDSNVQTYTTNYLGGGRLGSSLPTFSADNEIALAIIGRASNLAVGEREKLEGYAAWRYGMQGDLPGGHPYKSAAPTV